MNKLVGVWKLFKRILPQSIDIVSHNLRSEIESAKDCIGNTHSELEMSEQTPDDVVENVYDRPHVQAMIKESDIKQKRIATIMSGSSFDSKFQNWLWFTLFIVKIEDIRQIAFQERIWRDGFWAIYFPGHLAINPNGANRKKFFADIQAYSNMCLDPDLPFVIKTTENCGIGVFPNRTITDPNDGFMEYLYGFSFSMSCRYASQLQDCDMISDIVSITVSKNSRGLPSYYWICGPIGFVNHSCIANHCLVTVPVGNYLIGPFNDDEFKNIKKMTKHVYTCMEWQHVDNSVYSLKTVKMWDGISEFLVRYTYEGFGFQKMKFLCAYCYSANSSKSQSAPSSVRSLGTSVHDTEDTTAHAEATILITESFEGAFDHAGGSDFTTRGSEGKSKLSTSSTSENTLRASVSSRSQPVEEVIRFG